MNELPMTAPLWLVLFAAGCDRGSAGFDARTVDHAPLSTLITDSDRQFYFGTVISKPGRSLEHRYRLANSTSHDVKIVELNNRKPCCGTLRCEKRSLRPGEMAEVEVTLVVGEKFGGVVHEAEVVTDQPDQPSIVLRTSAVGQPALRVEEESRQADPLILGGEVRRRRIFRVFAAGTAQERPVDLDRAQLTSSIPVEWVSSKREGSPEGAEVVEERRFVAILDAAGEPGERRAEVRIGDGADVALNQVLTWEVVQPIAIAPKVVVIRLDGRPRRVTLNARDGSRFSISEIDGNDSGIKAHVLNKLDAATQIVEVEGPSKVPVKNRGTLTLHTNHSTQAKVELPFLILD